LTKDVLGARAVEVSRRFRPYPRRQPGLGFAGHGEARKQHELGAVSVSMPLRWWWCCCCCCCCWGLLGLVCRHVVLLSIVLNNKRRLGKVLNERRLGSDQICGL